MMIPLSILALTLSPTTDVDACLDQASSAFNVPRVMIEVLLEVEGGSVGQQIQNTNGTVDVGPMQINSHWADELESMGIDYEDVKNDPCSNVYVGTWVLALEYAGADGDWVEALARYHSRTPEIQARYLNRVLDVVERKLSE